MRLRFKGQRTTQLSHPGQGARSIIVSVPVSSVRWPENYQHVTSLFQRQALPVAGTRLQSFLFPAEILGGRSQPTKVFCSQSDSQKEGPKCLHACQATGCKVALLQTGYRGLDRCYPKVPTQPVSLLGVVGHLKIWTSRGKSGL